MLKRRPTQHEREIAKARSRILFYIDGGTRLVYTSRWIVSAIVGLFWLAVWLRGPR